MTAVPVKNSGAAAGRIAAGAFKYAVLLLFTAVALVPFVWMVSSSLKTSTDVFTIPMRWIPRTVHLENFAAIWEKVPLLAYFKNTTAVAIIVTLMQIITSSFAAYAFAKMRFPGRDALFLAYIGTIAVPWQVYMVPQFIMMRGAGLYDTIWALVVLQSFSAFGVFLMRQFYLGIPGELSEAARIDGLSEYGIWLKIILPLSKPAIGTMSIFALQGFWEEYFTAKVLVGANESMMTLPLLLQRLHGQYATRWEWVFAASILALIPIVILFILFQKKLVIGGLTQGSVKE